MRVPLLDLSEQYRALAEPIRAQLDEVLASQNFILGPKVAAFEEAIAQLLRRPNAIGVSSGTDALLAILMSLGDRPGDAVITSAYSFFATGRLHRARGRDAGFRRYRSRDLQHLARGPGALSRPRSVAGEKTDSCATRQGKIVRAIVPVHLFGLCCEMDAIHRNLGTLSIGGDRRRGPGDRRRISIQWRHSKSGHDGRSRATSAFIRRRTWARPATPEW